MQSKDSIQPDIWIRTGWIWTAAFHIAWIFVVFMGVRDPSNAEEVGRIVTLGIGFGVWQLTLFLGAWRRGWYERPFLMFPLVSIGVLIWYLLIRIDPLFYFLLGGLYPFIFIFLPIRWAIGMALIVNGLATYDNYLDSSGSSSWWTSGMLYWLGYSILAILLGVWIYAIIRQSTQRRELIQQLQATQDELAAAERREGVMQERDRLAREIHDTLAQGFTSIVMHLEAAEQAMQTDPDKLRHHLDQARRTARHSLNQAREVVADLRPELLAQQSLPAAIARVAERWMEETGIIVTATTTGDVIPLHPEIDVTLLRAVQEALANVRKHAHASAVTITLSYMGDMVILDVQDNGTGINGAAPSPLTGGFGLTAMRERVAQLNGSVVLESEVGEGTTLVVSVPMRTEADEATG